MIEKEITYDKSSEVFTVTLTIPKTMTGKYTFDDGEWEQDAVCVWINNNRHEYGLFETQYLDYKDSLQATTPIFYFDSHEEAEEFAKEYNLMIEYSREHTH